MESFTSDTQCRVHPWNSLCCIVVCSLDDSAPKIDKAILTAWPALIPKSFFFLRFHMFQASPLFGNGIFPLPMRAVSLFTTDCVNVLLLSNIA